MSEAASVVDIRPAQWPEDLAAARSLLLAYRHFLENSPVGAAHLCIDGFHRELDQLAERWAGHRAALLIAWHGTEPAGCVAVHLLADRAGAAEMKRMWVDPRFRGSGVGRMLVAAAADWARQREAAELVLDTAPSAMPEAQHLYRSLGFMPCERYNRNPVPGLAFFRLSLR